MSTKIEWTDATWNPTIGCTRVSAGCDHCYAFELHDKRYRVNRDAAKWLMTSRDEPVRRDGRTVAQQARELDSYALPFPAQYDVPFSRVQLMPDHLEKPLHWKKPRKVFVNSMSDLFHEDVPDEFIDRVFAVMALTPQHTYQLLTKRPERMRAYLNASDGQRRIEGAIKRRILIATKPGELQGVTQHLPLPNVWLGTSAEDQASADARIPHLLATPAAVRFLSCEPLLEGVQLPWMRPFVGGPRIGQCPIDWVIVGGESGPHARPFNIAWARSIRDQCSAAGVPVFVKQLGSKPAYPMFDGERGGIDEALDVGMPLGWSFEQDGSTWRRDPTGRRIGHMIRLRSPHGSDMAEWPEDLRIRQFPGDLTSPDARSAAKHA